MSFYAFKPTDKITINGIDGTYPRKDNCYNITVETTDKKGAVVTNELRYVPKPCVDLFLKMKETLNAAEINALYPLIEKIWDEAYTEAGDDYAMSEADESL